MIHYEAFLSFDHLFEKFLHHSFKDESNFINEDEPCYYGMLRSGQFKLPEGTVLATIEFRLKVSKKNCSVMNNT